MSAQTSIKSAAVDPSLHSKIYLQQKIKNQNDFSTLTKSWMSLAEPITIWSNDSFTVQGILEHLNVTKDDSDYLWLFTRYMLALEEARIFHVGRYLS